MGTEVALPPEEPETIFYVGHHETHHSDPLTLELLTQVRALGYDFLTTPITTSAFHARVLGQLEAYQEAVSQHGDHSSIPLPTIAPLSLKDTTLTPQDSNHSLVGLVSTWIALGSPDPVIAHISREILNLEVAYAAFCGINSILVYGPTWTTEIMQFARDTQEALGLGPYVQLHILLAMSGELEFDYGDGTHLSEMASDVSIHEDDEISGEPEVYEAWDWWNTIRTLCKYSHKLSLGM